MSDLLETFLAKPTAPVQPRREAVVSQRSIEISGSTLTMTIPDEPDAEGTALRYLEDEGLSPEEWEVTGFRKIEYGQGLSSVRFTYKRVRTTLSVSLTDAELEAVLSARPPVSTALCAPEVGATYVVALGDMQFGKAGMAETISRTMNVLDQAADALAFHLTRHDVTDICIAFLGDHVEGFVSQGGASTWRTPHTLTEQIRVTRRIMLYAMQRFAKLGLPVHMVAVPGNHGEAVRIGGTGVTRYDDSHDTECLIAVADAVSLNPEAFSNVSFYVPESDELSVALNLSDTNMVFTHGHKMKPGKYHEWIKGQAYNRNSLYRDCDLVFMGHFHHEHIEGSSDRMVIQVPALESESTWYRHAQGAEGTRGLLALIVADGGVKSVEFVRES